MRIAQDLSINHPLQGWDEAAYLTSRLRNKVPRSTPPLHQPRIPALKRVIVPDAHWWSACGPPAPTARSCGPRSNSPAQQVAARPARRPATSFRSPRTRRPANRPWIPFVGDAGDAVGLPHLLEELRAVPFPVEQDHEACAIAVGLEFLCGRLAGNLLE